MGSLSDTISTKSKVAVWARANASLNGTIPTCSPSALIKRTFEASIWSLIRAFFELPLAAGALSRLIVVSPIN
jgi:hypothetical protein